MIKINEQGTIGIMAALEQMRRGGVFTLVFVYGSGKRRGEIGLKKCVYGSPKLDGGQTTSAKPAAQQSAIGRHVEHGTLPLTDVEAVEGQQYITLLISHLRYINNLKIIF